MMALPAGDGFYSQESLKVSIAQPSGQATELAATQRRKFRLRSGFYGFIEVEQLKQIAKKKPAQTLSR
jgi:hypothetical protein